MALRPTPSSIANDQHLMIQDRRQFESGPTLGHGDWVIFFADKRSRGFRCGSIGQSYFDLERSHRDQFFHRRAPSAGAGEVDDVKDQAAALMIQFTIKQPRATDMKRERVAGGEAHGIG